jgi:8-oxo-dGTP pyrophosphatase MutT (NUDIX family)
MSTSFEARLRDGLTARRPQRLSVDHARDAAVLIPIVAGEGPSLILTRRTDTLSSHAGQISFPGGSVDVDDASPEAAALREAHEEIGLDPSTVRVLGELDSLQTFVSGFVVTPVIGWLDGAPSLVPNPGEVAEVLLVPVDALTEGARADPGFRHGGRTYPTEAWIVDDNVIWGVTARILRSFLHTLADAGLAEAPGGVPADAGHHWPPRGRESGAGRAGAVDSRGGHAGPRGGAETS